MEKNQTLKETLDEIGVDDVTKYVHQKLILVQMLTNVQNNLLLDIKNKLEDNSKYKYDVKHCTEDVRKAVKKGLGISFFKRLSTKSLDYYMGDYEELESMIYKWAEISNHNKYDNKLQ